MATVYVDINPNVLQWIIENSDYSSNSTKLKQDFPKIEEWLNDGKNIAYGNIEKLASKTHIPFGYFFLDQIPEEDIPILNYRTMKNKNINKPSRNLIDTLLSVEEKQNWVHDYLIENGFEKLEIVGKGINRSEDFITNDIREKLNIDKEWYKNVVKDVNIFNYFRNKIEDLGVFVIVNSFVNNSTKRHLDTKEFRAFLMLDEYCPFIFINSSDYKPAQLFSLVHELVHVWLGKEDIVRFDDYTYEAHSDIEDKCNRIAAEILVPKASLEKEWNMNIDLYDLQKKFHVSGFVIIKKAYDDGLINKNQYYHMYKLLENEYLDFLEKKIEKKKDSGGPSFFVYKKFVLGAKFLNIVRNQTFGGKLLYTDAYRLIGAKGNTFDKIMNGGGF